jgi:hypothetical protein
MPHTPAQTAYYPHRRKLNDGFNRCQHVSYWHLSDMRTLPCPIHLDVDISRIGGLGNWGYEVSIGAA